MPPVHELHAVHRIQKNLRPDLIASLLSPLKRRVLEHQTNTVVAHVSAHVDCEQGKCEAHDYRDEDVV